MIKKIKKKKNLALDANTILNMTAFISLLVRFHQNLNFLIGLNDHLLNGNSIQKKKKKNSHLDEYDHRRSKGEEK